MPQETSTRFSQCCSTLEVVRRRSGMQCLHRQLVIVDIGRQCSHAFMQRQSPPPAKGQPTRTTGLSIGLRLRVPLASLSIVTPGHTCSTHSITLARRADAVCWWSPEGSVSGERPTARFFSEACPQTLHNRRLSWQSSTLLTLRPTVSGKSTVKDGAVRMPVGL